jgi:hypothetical protein
MCLTSLQCFKNMVSKSCAPEKNKNDAHRDARARGKSKSREKKRKEREREVFCGRKKLREDEKSSTKHKRTTSNNKKKKRERNKNKPKRTIWLGKVSRLFYSNITQTIRSKISEISIALCLHQLLSICRNLQKN